MSHNDINLRTLHLNSSKVKVTGNVLTLLSCTWKPVESKAQSKLAWVWNGAYLKTDSPVPGCEGMTTEKVIEIGMLGSLIEPLNPSVVEVLVYLPAEKTAKINSRGVTWLLKDDVLTTAINLVWKCALGMKIPVSSLTLIRVTGGMSKQFPYHLTDGTCTVYPRSSSNVFLGTLTLVCKPASSLLSSSKVAGVAWICPLCREPTDDIRSHMGQHVLRSIRDIKESLISPVDHLFPCRFCSQSQLVHPECVLKIKITSLRGPEFLTDCSFKAQIKFGYADKGSQKRPC